MIDQATTLRRMSAQPSIASDFAASTKLNDGFQVMPDAAASAFSIAITSGKGGVGKSNVAVNVALELAALKRRVTLLDADLALANADVLLGLNPRFHLGHVLKGERTLDEVVITTHRNLRLVPGGSGIEELANLTSARSHRLIAELRAMEAASDFLLIDTAAGIAGNVTGVLRAANAVVIVTTPDPTALVDAYALLKVMLRAAPDKFISVVINNVVGINDAEATFVQLRAAARSFLNHELHFLGMVPTDTQLVEAVREQIPVVEFAPDASSSRALRLIAKQLIKTQRNDAHAARTPQSFWASLTEEQV